MILILGKNGQVGSSLSTMNFKTSVQVMDERELDLTRPDEVRSCILKLKPKIVVNAAAYTAVDAAESDRERCYLINTESVGAMAKACREIGGRLIHYSTDYIFNGEKKEPYVETDRTQPLGWYGKTKEWGEELIRLYLSEHIILRTSWVFSPGGKNFLRSLLKLARERETLRIVSDQRGSPTLAEDLARATHQICLRENAPSYGTFHLVNQGSCSWWEFAQYFIQEAQKKKSESWKVKEILPISTAEYPTPALRPLNSRLDCKKIHEEWGIQLRPWTEATINCLNQIESSNTWP